jgi:hypothetical protein
MRRNKALTAFNFIATAVLVGLLAVACTPYKAYEGQEIAASKRAVITSVRFQQFWGLGGSGLAIKQIDGMPVRDVAGVGVQVKPGKRRVLFTHSVSLLCIYVCFETASTRTLLFDAKAGHRYELNSTGSTNTLSPWIEDKDTGEIVAR